MRSDSPEQRTVLQQPNSFATPVYRAGCTEHTAQPRVRYTSVALPRSSTLTAYDHTARRRIEPNQTVLLHENECTKRRTSNCHDTGSTLSKSNHTTSIQPHAPFTQARSTSPAPREMHRADAAQPRRVHRPPGTPSRTDGRIGSSAATPRPTERVDARQGVVAGGSCARC